MMPLKQFIDRIREYWVEVDIRYAHPSLYLIVTDEDFFGLNVEEREQKLITALKYDTGEVARLTAADNVVLSLVTPSEKESEIAFLQNLPSAHHWIEFLAGANHEIEPKLRGRPTIIHFYGYKGGQGRSTVLAMLAKALADDGYQVLAIDADIEAPSLPAQFETRTDTLESTLLGCIQYGETAAPLQVYVPKTSQGSVDLLACKPSGSDYDLDLAIFALNSALDPARIQSGFRKILANAKPYEVILVDHRSGISSSILPLVRGFPGPVVVCMRLDEQSDESDGYVRVLLRGNSQMPGMFVSFSLDPDETAERLRAKSGARIESLLDILATSISEGAETIAGDSPLEITPDALQSYWISWFHDRSFLTKPSPSVADILSSNRESLNSIRELVGLSQPIKASNQATKSPQSPKILTNSGNTDEGLLIQTDALRKLRAPNSNYRYIFGRKGTGKTRLVKALVDEGHGSALLSAEDFNVGDAISSADPLFLEIAEKLFKEGSPDKLWWIVLDCALKSSSVPVRQTLENWLERIREGSDVSISNIANEIENLQESRVYFIDGVETAFTSSQMSVFVRGLFRFLGLIQSNSRIATKLTIRLFLRTDLAQFGSENLEQQVDGRRLTLSWDTQSIFNFALSRIAALPWFRANFSHAVEHIEGEEEQLSKGELSTDECDDILLQIFPATVRRNNLLTLTFLKTYFSEGEGETASYYPRIYDAFLRGIDTPSNIGPEAARLAQIEEGHVGQDLIIKAHDYASEQYLRQVAAELKNLVRLSDDSTENMRRVESLLPIFRGLPTPFMLKTCLQTVQDRMSAEFEIDPERVKSALEQMKRVGIFEERPGWDGWWRAGRLFKNALGMKYVR